MGSIVIGPPALGGAAHLVHLPVRLAIAVVVLALAVGTYLAVGALSASPRPTTVSQPVEPAPALRPIQAAGSQASGCGVGISGDLVGEHGNPAEVQAASLALCASAPQP